jgi:hypothetical protein
MAVNKKRVAAFGGLAAFGILTAAAASLGGLSSSSLGADQTVIASCDTDGITLAYTNAYDATTNSYKTSAVVATLVNVACAAKSYKLTLSNGAASLGEFTNTVTLVGTTLTIPISPTVDSKSITKAALVIS